MRHVGQQKPDWGIGLQVKSCLKRHIIEDGQFDKDVLLAIYLLQITGIWVEENLKIGAPGSQITLTEAAKSGRFGLR